MSQQERVSWVSLGVTLFFAVWYFSFVLALPADANLMSSALARFVTKLLGLALVATIVGEALLRWLQRQARGAAGADATAIDERDTLIDLKATRNAYAILGAGVIVVLVQILLIESVQRLASGSQRQADTMFKQLLIGPMTGLHVAQLLLFVLILSGLAIYISRIVYYRRGY